MPGRLVLDEDARICAWLDAQMGYQTPSPVKASIGYEIDGELVTGVVFDNVTDNNVFAHIANTRRRGISWELLGACYAFMFGQLGLERVTFLVREDNERCLRMVQKMGAQFEARLARACKTCDQLIYVLWRNPVLDAVFLPAART